MAATRKRRLAIRIVLIAALVGVASLMYNIGREYNVLFDNETVTVDGKEYPAVEYAELIIDGNEDKKTEIFADDRIIEKMIGSKHTLALTIINEGDNKVIGSIERSVRLNVDTQKWMISLAALAGGATNVFIPNPLAAKQEEPSEEETLPSEEATMDNPKIQILEE